MRSLSTTFFNNLKDKDGLLNKILERVKNDHTLMLAIRGNYINIYYRGGNILKLDEKSENEYITFFDEKYNKSDNKLSIELPKTIREKDDVKKWLDALPYLKEVMDLYFTKTPKSEREFQQLIVRENNFSTISNESEYFISDIEFSDSEYNARFDLLGVQWLANQRKNGSNCRAALIEMKYGDDSLGGASGLVKHLRDFEKLISNKESYSYVLKTMENQFAQLDKLELLKFNHSSNGVEVKLDANDKPQVIFILANHNPRSSKLLSIVSNQEVINLANSEYFDLRFFVSQFAGYGLHEKCLVTLEQFRKLLVEAK